MRTTLDIDPVVLSAARSKARAEKVSLGKAVSELALAGLTSAPLADRKTRKGFPVMHGDPERPVTDELVERYRDDDPEDA